jgi:hypothetical protein
MEESNDVDLEALLATELGEDTTPVASDENSVNDKPVSEDVKPVVEPEQSSRAQERIRELVEENNRLKSAQTHNSELDSFVASIEDAPSRELLKQYGSLLEKNIYGKFEPVLNEYHTARFEKDFNQYLEKIPDLAAHKTELMKTYMRDPSQSIKSLVGDTLLDIQTTKIKPIETATSQPSRTPPKLSDDASEEDLYNLLDTLKS